MAGVASLAGLEAILESIDPEMRLPDSARRLPRGHTDGPRPVALPDGWLDNRDDPDPPAPGGDEAVSGG
jgi:hypothetical protein